jgi:sulfoxide reductase catalytic subunit YedY
MEDLLKMFPQEDRIYRLRCVEAWSMVIPWRGFPLASLLKVVEPDGCKYVATPALLDPERFPGGAISSTRGPTRKGCALTRRWF